jgi:hypothetical protein
MWLKVLVIVMGILIVVGFIVVAAEIARRMSTGGMSSANVSAPPAGTAFTQRVALPGGARVVSMTAAGERLVVHVELPGGQAAAYIIEPRNGTLLGTVEFPPGAR